MKNRGFRHRLEYAGFLTARFLLLRLPHAWVRGLGHACGRAFHALSPRHRRLPLANLARALPETDSEQRRWITRRCFAHFGATFFEVVSAARFDPRAIDRRFDIEGWEHVESARAAGRGLFFMSGHFGTWELAIYPLARRLGALHAVARPPDNPLVAGAVARIRERFGVRILPPQGAGRQMHRIVKAGGAVALVIDQRVRPSEGLLLPFLARPAWTTSVPAFLSLKTGAPVLPVICVPAAGGGYRIRIHAPIAPEGAGEEAEVALTRRYLAVLEQELRERPELFLWLYRRWQLTSRHSWPSSIARLRREARLPHAPAPAADAEPLTLVDEPFLEGARDAVLLGPAGVARARVLCALGHRLVDAGHPIRYAEAGALARELLAARLSVRALDGFDLLLLDGLELSALPAEALPALERLLEHRRGRRSTLAAATRAPTTPGASPALARFFAEAATRRLDA